MEIKTVSIQCRISGLRPLMFDRYAGDNSTRLPPEEKFYLVKGNHLALPAVNVFSLLCAENTKSVCRQFFGKQGKTIALGIASYVTIDEMDLPIMDDNGPIVFDGWNEKIFVHKSVARVKGGIPNPKERPTVNTPWHVEFSMNWQDNKQCNLENLRQAVTMGGILGIGTFRPYYGRYELTRWLES